MGRLDASSATASYPYAPAPSSSMGATAAADAEGIAPFVAVAVGAGVAATAPAGDSDGMASPQDARTVAAAAMTARTRHAVCRRIVGSGCRLDHIWVPLSPVSVPLGEV